MYALRPKGKACTLREYACIAHTEDELEQRIEKAYWNWRGMQARSSDNVSKDDFLRGKERVKITVEVI